MEMSSLFFTLNMYFIGDYTFYIPLAFLFYSQYFYASWLYGHEMFVVVG